MTGADYATVLLVDDDLEYLSTIKELLMNDYIVFSANNAAEGIEIACDGAIDVIIMDLKMPEIDGLTACGVLKANPVTADIPILMLTASRDESDSIRAFEAGAVDYVNKPIKPAELLARLRVHSQNRILHRRLSLKNEALRAKIDSMHETKSSSWENIAEELRLSQQHLHSVISNLPVILFVLDSNGIFTLSEGKGLSALGLEPGQVIGQSAIEMYADYPDIVLAIRQTLEGKTIRQRHLIGNLIFDSHYAPLAQEQGEYGVIGVAVDVTDQVQIELKQMILFDISRATSRATDTADLLQVVRERLSLMVNAENFFVALYEGQQGLYTFPYWSDVNDKPTMAQGPLTGSLTDYVRRTGKSVMIQKSDREHLRQQGEITLVGTESAVWLGVPLRTSERIIGVMALQHYEDEDAFSEADLQLLTYIGENIAWVIDSQKKEDALRLSEERFSKAFFSSPISVTLSKDDGTLIDANAGFERLFGYTRDEAIHQPNFTNGLYANYEDRAYALDKVKKYGRIHDYEVDFINRSGIRLHCIMSLEQIEVGGEQVLLGNIRDMTRQKRLVNRLQTLNEINHAIARVASPEAVASVTVEHLSDLFEFPYISVISADPGTFTMDILAWSLPQDPPKGLTLHHSDQVKIERLRQGESHHNADLSDSDPLSAFEKGLVNLGVRSYVVIPMMVDQLFVGLFVLGRHETGVIPQDMLQIGQEVATLLSVALRQAQLYEQIQEYTDTLEMQVIERTNQLSRKAQELEAFTYSVSHDLRAPLRAMNGFAELLMEDFHDHLPEDAQFYLTRIRHNAQHMSQLIDDLLGLSRIGRQELKKRTFDPTAMVEDIIEELTTDGQIGQAQITIEAMPSCEADPALLRQVWVNLLSNAIKYSHKVVEPCITVSAHRDDHGKVIYQVADNGIGFDMDYQDKLFKVFQRLHTDYEGTGIGLATVARIIERHGGKIWAEGQPDAGAIFYFWI